MSDAQTLALDQVEKDHLVMLYARLSYEKKAEARLASMQRALERGVRPSALAQATGMSRARIAQLQEQMR